MKTRTLPLLLAFAASIAFASPALAAEKVTLEQVPAKVKETIQKHVQNGKLNEIEREKKKGVTVYEVEYTAAGGMKYEIEVGEDGKVLSTKKHE
jgi:uncharacterized membrane protein YkoI